MAGPAFIIVGTPRSGTTLVQRFASDLDGVRVPPETHFFTDFAWSLRGRRRLPLAGDDLREALRDYRGRSYMRDVDLSVDGVVERLGGRCTAMVAMYAAVVDELAGPVAIVGEKTPSHLLWWRPLSRALPDLKVVCVVRDPRAVVSSYLGVGWSQNALGVAMRWRDDIARVQRCLAHLGPSRALLVRYEDAVSDEDRVREALGEFLGTPVDRSTTPRDAEPLFAPWESWKAAALGSVDPSRSEVWRHDLTDRQVGDIEAICRRAMAEVGYDVGLDRTSALARRVRLPISSQVNRIRYRLRRHWREAGITRIARRWEEVASPRYGAMK